MLFVECRGHVPFDIVEVSLWHEAFRWCLGSHDRRDSIEETAMRRLSPSR